MPSILKKFITVMFADDSTFIITGNDLRTLVIQANVELKLFYNWCISNRLTVNISKTKYMIFTGLKNYLIPPLYINFLPIDQTSFHKMLGVIIDDKLSFKQHINHLCLKLSKSSSLLYKKGS